MRSVIRSLVSLVLIVVAVAFSPGDAVAGVDTRVFTPDSVYASSDGTVVNLDSASVSIELTAPIAVEESTFALSGAKADVLSNPAASFGASLNRPEPVTLAAVRYRADLRQRHATLMRSRFLYGT